MYSAEDALFIAAALIEYNTDTEPIEEARYGELTIEHLGWRDNDWNYTALEYHQCSDGELGFVRTPETVIYPWFKTY